MNNNRVEIEFSVRHKEIFNKYIVEYSSSLYLECKIFYNKDDYVYCEHFFLEPGDHAIFSSYVDGAINEEDEELDIWGVYKLEAAPLTEGEMDFKLHSLKVTNDDLFGRFITVENQDFRLTFDTKWGGALCGFIDKTSVYKLGNLLNVSSHERFLQQSYLGVSDILPYSKPDYNNEIRCYHPVQVGDGHEHQSKLIDVEADRDSVYVKVQPLDWSFEARRTKSYMETLYRFDRSCVYVTNKYTDFTGYNHPVRRQALPGIYVISYLNRFICYKGTEPWRDTKYYAQDNMPYWGSEQNRRICVRELEPGNNETWCAWVSRRTGYGLGVFTPDVTTLVSGMYNYNGSKDSMDDAANYMAPSRNLCLKSFEPFLYKYILTAGTISQMQDVFYDNKNIKNESSFAKFVPYRNGGI